MILSITILRLRLLLRIEGRPGCIGRIVLCTMIRAKKKMT